MAPGGSTNAPFLPFNLSSVLPFDSLAAALAELPSPQVREPFSQDSKFFESELHMPPPTKQMQASVLQLLCHTAQEGAWSHISESASDASQQQPASSRRPPSPAWVNRLSQQLLTRLKHSRTRPSLPSPSSSERKSPKRPRRAPVVIALSSDSDEAPTAKPIEALRPVRNSTVHPVDVHPAPVKMRRAPVVAADEHSQEVKAQQLSRIIDLDEFNCFVDFLRSFVNRAERLSIENHHRFEPELQVTSNFSYLLELREKVTLHATQGAIPHIPTSVIARVVSILEHRISESLRQCDVEAHISDGSSSVILGVNLGLIAASIVLAILCAPESPRILLVEELLDKIVSLLRTVSTSLIYPSFDPLYREAMSKRGQKRTDTNQRSTKSAKQKQGDDVSKGSGGSTLSARVAKGLLDSCCSLYESLTTLFMKERHLPDSFVTHCGSTCVDSLSVTGIHRLHIHSMRTACSIFLNYSAHRLWLLDNVVRDVAGNLPANRRHLRCFQLPGGRAEVRVSSALIAEFICLASIDNDASPEAHRSAEPGEEGDRPWSLLQRERHDLAAKMAARVWESFLKRSFTEKESESRVAFQALFEDVLLLYGRPEWPSAELMLQTISVSLISKMRAEEEKSAYLRAFSIEVLGALATKMCDLYGDEVVQEPGDIVSLQSQSSVLEQEREKLLLYLERNKSLLFRAANSFYESLFVTDDRDLAISLHVRSQRNSSKQDGQADTDNEEELRESAWSLDDSELPIDVEGMASSRAKNVERRRAHKDHIGKELAIAAARFVGFNRSFVRGFRTILDSILDGMQDPAPTVRAKSIKALSSVDEACHGILRVLPSVLWSIEASCRDVSILARDAALDLLSRSLVQNVASKSDRKSSDGLKVQQSLDDHEIFQRVFSIVEKRLLDTSTSVRKRAVSIMRAVMSDALKRCECSSQGQGMLAGNSVQMSFDENRVVQICNSLVPRLDDSEKSVREASERTIRLGLFGLDISGPVPLHRMQDSQAVALVSQRLTAVFMRLPLSSHHSFMTRIFQNSTLVDATAFLSAVVNASVDLLHLFEDALARIIGEKKVSDLSPSDSAAVTSVSKKRVGCCSVLRGFSALEPSLLSSHCRTLAPCIKGVLERGISQDDLECVLRILNVLELGVGTAGDWDIEFLEELMHDVELLVCQSPFVLPEEAAVRCWCVVARKAGTSQAKELLQMAASNFMAFLTTQKDAMKEHCHKSRTDRVSALERNARSALVRLGLLTRYGNFEREFVSEVYEALESMCNILCQSSTRDNLAKASVRALSHVLISHRYLLTKGTEVLKLALENSIPNDHHIPNTSGLNGEQDGSGSCATSFADGVQLFVLQGFHELLRDEEHRNSSQKESHGRVSVPSKTQKRHTDHSKSATRETSPAVNTAHVQDTEQPVLAAEEDAEAGYLALSAQAMIPHLQRAVDSRSDKVRQTLANILGLLVRQGLVLPSTVISSLFCLLLDYDPRCRECSFRVVTFLADRHSEMLASDTVQALRRCFESSFRVRYSSLPVVPESVHSGGSVVNIERILKMSIDNNTGQSLLSQTIMAMRRNQRRGVLENVMREFDPRVSLRRECPEKSTSAIEVHNIVVLNGVSGDVDGRMVSADMIIPDEDEEDEDIGPSSCAEMDIEISEKLCSLPMLYFFAMTLATLDYTDGAGIGGSLTQGGGTAAADTKLKFAREDVSQLVGIATRIISNSGQATLQVAKRVMRYRDVPEHNLISEKLRRVALCASRISLLLLLKHHLKVTRWKAVLESGESDFASSSLCRMPPFCPGDTELQVWMSQRSSVDTKSAEQMKTVLESFVSLMRKDAIDESDVNVSARTSRSGRGTRKRSTGGSKSGKRVRTKQGADVGSGVGRKQRPGRYAAQIAAKKLRFEEDSD